MRKILLIAIATITTLGAWAAPMMPDFKVDRIEPTNWFVGMKDPSLQLMVYGRNVRDAEVTTSYAGVKIDSLVRLESPNYLLVYLNTTGAQPGVMTLNFKGKTYTLEYTI